MITRWNKGPSSQGYGFSSGHVWMWDLDCEESWAPKNWYFRTVVLEKTLESPLFCKEIQPVHPKGDESWVFIGRTDAKAETPILWPPHGKSWLIGKDSDAGRDWGQEEKGTQRMRWLDGITNSRSSLRFTSIESVMPSSHLILSSPSPPAPNPSQHQPFPMSQLFAWGGQSTGVPALASVFVTHTFSLT